MTVIEKLRAEMVTLQGEAETQFSTITTEDREYTAEEKAAQDARYKRMESLKAKLDEQARFATLAVTGDKDKPAAAVRQQAEPPGKDAADRAAGNFADKPDLEELGRAATQWALTGNMAAEFATITTATASGLLLPKSIAPPIAPDSANVFREAHAFYGVKPIETANTADLTIPVLDATAGGVVAENASSETENVPGLTEAIRLTPKTYQSGSVWFSNQQLAATDFDLLASVLPSLTYSKELGLESAIVAALIADAGITNVVATSTTAAFTYANLVSLNRALPKRYDRQKAIVLGAAAYADAEKLVGSDGHPVLILDPQNQQLLRFNGTPVLRSDYFEAWGASKVIGAVFSLLGFRLRDVTQQNLARYVNQPAKPNQTGLDLFAYHAYGWAPSAVAKLKTPIS